MHNLKKSEVLPKKRLNIFFPENVNIIKENVRYNLFGLSDENTFLILHISNQLNCENTSDKGSICYHKYVKFIGIIQLVKEEKKLNKEDLHIYNKNNDPLDFIYLNYYINKPLLVYKKGEKENVKVLFILYNTQKFIYNISLDHIQNLMMLTHATDITYFKKVNKENSDESTNESVSTIHKSKKGRVADLFNFDSEDENKNEKKKVNRNDIDEDVDDKTVLQKEKYTNDKKAKNLKNNKKVNPLEKLGVSFNLKNETNYTLFNFEENIIKPLPLCLKNIIFFINKNNSIADEFKKNGNSLQKNNSSEFNETKKYSFVTEIILFLVYLISHTNKLLYFMIHKFYICHILKLDLLIITKEKLLLHSEWYDLYNGFLKNKHVPEIYYQYKYLLLVRFFNMIIDVCSGIILYFFFSLNKINLFLFFEKFRFLYDSKTLTSILGILLQNPLGFKLNNNFTVFIGSIIISVLEKWDYCQHLFVMNQKYLQKHLWIIFLFGISFVLSLLIDYLKFITLHVKFIFYFSKKLCSIFNSNIYSLYLLFNGKKWNILKLRVDTNYYTNEEVIFGTILFTILIFLYPTIFIFSLVFGFIYFIVVGIIYVISMVKSIFLNTPFYVLFMPSHYNKYISKGIKFTNDV